MVEVQEHQLSYSNNKVNTLSMTIKADMKFILKLFNVLQLHQIHY